MKTPARPWFIAGAIALAFIGGVGVGVKITPHGVVQAEAIATPRVPASSTTSVDTTLASEVKRAAGAGIRRRQDRATSVPGSVDTWDLKDLYALALRHEDQLEKLLAGLDETQCWDLINRLYACPPTAARNEVIKIACRRAASDDPVAFIKSLGTTPDSVFKTDQINDLLGTWAQRSPEAAARWMSGVEAAGMFDAGRLEMRLMMALQGWSNTDGQAAAKFIDTLSAGQSADGVMTMACMNWGEADPTAALAWIDSLPDSDQRKQAAVEGVATGLAGQDPAKAAAFVQGQIASGYGKPYLLSMVAGQWAETDPQAAANWAASINDPDLRPHVMASLLGSWARVDTQSAALWAAALPADAARGTAWAGLLLTWTTSDPDGAARWLESVSPGADRDGAIALYAAAMTRTHPEQALAMVQTISSPTLNAAELNRALLGWAHMDPAAAAQWASVHGVSLPVATDTTGGP